jgi:ABC-2 type transport system ATP-binding protein
MTEATEHILVVKALTKRYPGMEHPALDALDLCIPRGEIFGLLGPNGAGKTTAISILSTLLRPTAGSVRLKKIDLLRHPMQARRIIGVVPQDIALYPQLSAWENLAYFGRLHGLRGRRLDGCIRAALAAVGLEKRQRHIVASFSGGMKRRVNLAAGFLHGPELLFLDEPTVGVDIQSRRLIMDKLLEIGEGGTTMIYTTHYMEEAHQLCNRVAIMDRGRILAQGTPQALVAQSPDCDNLGELFLRLTGRELRDDDRP